MSGIGNNVTGQMPAMHGNKVHKNGVGMGQTNILMTLGCVLFSVVIGFIVIFIRWRIYIMRGKDLDDLFIPMQQILWRISFTIALLVSVETVMPSRFVGGLADLTWRNNRYAIDGDGPLFFVIYFFRFTYKIVTFIIWLLFAGISVPFTIIHNIVQFVVYIITRKDLNNSLYKIVYYCTLILYIAFLLLYLKRLLA